MKLQSPPSSAVLKGKKIIPISKANNESFINSARSLRPLPARFVRHPGDQVHPLSSYGHQFIFFPQLFYSDPAVNPIMTQLLLTDTIPFLYLFLKSELFLRYFDF